MTKNSTEALDRLEKNKYRHGGLCSGDTQMSDLRARDIETIRQALSVQEVGIGELEKSLRVQIYMEKDYDVTEKSTLIGIVLNILTKNYPNGVRIKNDG